MRHGQTGRQTRLVARRELRIRLRSRALRITTVLFVVVVLGVGVISRIAKDRSPSRTAVATLGAVPDGFAAALIQVGEASGRPMRLDAPLADRAAADEALRDGSVDVVVDGSAGQLVFHRSVDPTDAAVVGAAWPPK